MLDVSKNIGLNYLDCDNNQLTMLDVSKNISIQELSCRDNFLATLDVSKITNLQELYCQDNELAALDLTRNTNLNYLNCSNNQLKGLDVSKITNLYTLRCYGNFMTDQTDVVGFKGTWSSSSNNDNYNYVFWKQNPTYTKPAAQSAVYGQLLKDIALPAGWAWMNPNDSVGNAGTQTHKAKYTPAANPDPSKYNASATNISLAVTVNKAAGTFGSHYAVSAVYTPTLTLADLNTLLLPNYVWAAPTTVLNAGNSQSFAAKYTHPSGNYETVDGNITVHIAKANPTSTAPTNLTAIVGQKLASVALPAGWVWLSPSDLVGVVGTQKHKA
jgi:hypothetical protein